MYTHYLQCMKNVGKYNTTPFCVQLSGIRVQSSTAAISRLHWCIFNLLLMWLRSLTYLSIFHSALQLCSSYMLHISRYWPRLRAAGVTLLKVTQGHRQWRHLIDHVWCLSHHIHICVFNSNHNTYLSGIVFQQPGQTIGQKSQISRAKLRAKSIPAGQTFGTEFGVRNLNGGLPRGRSLMIFKPFWHRSQVWQTDRQTDEQSGRQTNEKNDRIVWATLYVAETILQWHLVNSVVVLEHSCNKRL